MITRLKTHTPAWCIAFAFLLTASIARWISLIDPTFHIELADGRHIHHYVIGIFTLAFAGYLAMIFKGPRAAFWIALLYGFGAGLAFDEYGMWLNLRSDIQLRWSSTGVMIIIAALIMCIAAPILWRLVVAAPANEPQQERRESPPEAVALFSQE